MFGITKQGFTLIEILIAVALIAIMAAVVVPNLGKKSAGQERNAFIARLNALTQLAWQNALIQNKMYKVVFNFKKKIVSLEQQVLGKKEAKGEPKFEPVNVAYSDTSLTWPSDLQIKNFFLEGFDEMSRYVGGDTGTSWFLVVPDGLTQRVTINIQDMKDRDDKGRPKKFGLVLNPFNARFTTHDTFKK